MNDNSAASSSSLAPSPSDGDDAKRLSREGKSASAAADDIHTILAAAIGLTGLGAPAAPGAGESPQVNVAAAAAASLTQRHTPPREEPESTEEPPRESRKGPAAAAPDHVANAATGDGLRPTPYPHLFPHYPNPPEADEPSAAPRAGDDRGAPLLLKCRRYEPPSKASGNKNPRSAPTAGGLNFPEILHVLITDPANSHILAWLPHGQGFVVHDRDLFASKLLKRHFDGAKYTSFTRRLKRWKFDRVPSGPEMGAYYNKRFVRGRPDLVKGMVYGAEDGEETKDEKGGDDKEEKKTKEKKKKPHMEGGLAGKSNGKEKHTEEMKERSLEDSPDDAMAESTAVEVPPQDRDHEQPKLDAEQHDQKRGLDEDAVVHASEVRGGQSKKKKKKENGKPTAEAEPTVGAAYGNAMAEAATEAHRQKLKLQPTDLETNYGDKSSNGGPQEAAQFRDQTQALLPSAQGSPGVEAAMEVQQRQLRRMQLSRDLESSFQRKHPVAGCGSSSDEKLPIPYSPAPSRQVLDYSNLSGSSSADIFISPNPKEAQARQHQRQLKLMQMQSSKESSGPELKQPYHQDPMTLQRKRKYQNETSIKYDSWDSPGDLQMRSMPTWHNPQDYLAMTMARRNTLASASIADAASLGGNTLLPRDIMASCDRDELLMHMMAHRSSRAPGATAFLCGNDLPSGHLDYFSHLDNGRPQRLGDVERLALLEASYPMLHAASFSDPIFTRSFLRSNSSGGIRGPHSTSAYLRSSSIEDRWMSCSYPGASKNLFLANAETTQTMLDTSKTHKEIMLMAARDLQARALGVGHLPSASPPQQRWVQRSQSLREHLAMQQQQQLLPPRRQSGQKLPLLSRVQPLPSGASYLPSHAVSLRELEEEVEREALATRTATAAGLQEEGENGQASPTNRRNRGASAA